MEEKVVSPLIPPPSEIDLEAGGGGDQLQCRICLETDGEGGAPARACCRRRRLFFFSSFLGADIFLGWPFLAARKGI